jgi:hypothetical protein
MIAQAATEVATYVKWEQVLMGLTTIASLLVAIAAWRKSSVKEATVYASTEQSKQCAVDHAGIRGIMLEQGATLRTATENLTRMVDAFSALAHSLALRDKDYTIHHAEVLRLLADISKKLEK